MPTIPTTLVGKFMATSFVTKSIFCVMDMFVLLKVNTSDPKNPVTLAWLAYYNDYGIELFMYVWEALALNPLL